MPKDLLTWHVTGRGTSGRGHVSFETMGVRYGRKTSLALTLAFRGVVYAVWLVLFTLSLFGALRSRLLSHPVGSNFACLSAERRDRY